MSVLVVSVDIEREETASMCVFQVQTHFETLPIYLAWVLQAIMIVKCFEQGRLRKVPTDSKKLILIKGTKLRN